MSQANSCMATCHHSSAMRLFPHNEQSHASCQANESTHQQIHPPSAKRRLPSGPTLADSNCSCPSSFLSDLFSSASTARVCSVKETTCNLRRTLLSHAPAHRMNCSRSSSSSSAGSRARAEHADRAADGEFACTLHAIEVVSRGTECDSEWYVHVWSM